MGVLFTLTKNYLGEISGLMPSSKSEKKTKGLGFKVVIGFLVALGMGALLYGAWSLLFSLAQALASKGLQDAVLGPTVFGMLAMGFLFSFLNLLSVLVFSPTQDLLLSLPIPPWKIIFSRLFAVYIQVIPLLAIFCGGGLAGYWFYSGTGILGLVGIILGLLLIPLVPLAAAFSLAVLLLSIGGPLRNKDFATTVLGGVAIFVGVGLQIPLNNFIKQIQDPHILNNWSQSMGLWFEGLREQVPPFDWMVRIPQDVIGLGLSTVFGVGIVIGVGGLFSGVFSKVLRESGQRVAGKAGKLDNFSSRSLGLSLMVREFRLLCREPMFLLNGPLVLVILPVVIIIMALANLSAVKDHVLELQSLPDNLKDILLATMGAFGVFLAGSTSVNATGFSREGKGFFFLKTLPLDFLRLARIKLLHGCLYSLLGLLLIQVPLVIFGGFDLVKSLLIIAATLVISLGLQMFSLVVDLGRPRLVWDNPLAAMKQNTNALIALGAVMVAALTWVLPVTPLAGLPLVPWTGLMILLSLGWIVYAWKRAIPQGVQALLKRE